MTTTALLIAALLGVQQTDPQPDGMGRGCGFTPGSDRLFEIVVGRFESEKPLPIADQYGQSVRIDGRWTHPDQTPHGAVAGRAWIEAHPTITVRGREYQRHGLPLVFGIGELRWFAEIDGRAATVEPFAQTPEVLYVLTEPTSCGFQPYRLPEPKA